MATAALRPRHHGKENTVSHRGDKSCERRERKKQQQPRPVLLGRCTNSSSSIPSEPQQRNSSSLKCSLASSWNMIRRQMAEEYEKDNREPFLWGDDLDDLNDEAPACMRQLVSSPNVKATPESGAVHRYLNERLQRMRNSERGLRGEVQDAMRALLGKMEKLEVKEGEYLDGLQELAQVTQQMTIQPSPADESSDHQTSAECVELKAELRETTARCVGS